MNSFKGLFILVFSLFFLSCGYASSVADSPHMKALESNFLKVQQEATAKRAEELKALQEKQFETIKAIPVGSEALDDTTQTAQPTPVAQACNCYEKK